MKTHKEDDSHEIINSIQERATLWRQFIARQDC